MPQRIPYPNLATRNVVASLTVIMRISDAPVTEMAAPEVADSLPAEVPTQDLPDDIIREIPLVRGHKFVKFDDRILVVSSSRLVVAMIPRYKLLP